MVLHLGANECPKESLIAIAVHLEVSRFGMTFTRKCEVPLWGLAGGGVTRKPIQDLCVEGSRANGL